MSDEELVSWVVIIFLPFVYSLKCIGSVGRAGWGGSLCVGRSSCDVVYT